MISTGLLHRVRVRVRDCAASARCRGRRGGVQVRRCDDHDDDDDDDDDVMMMMMMMMMMFRTEIESKCEDETSGYTTNTKCSDWPVER